MAPSLPPARCPRGGGFGFGLFDAASGDDSEIFNLPNNDFLPPAVLPAAIADSSFSVYTPEGGSAAEPSLSSPPDDGAGLLVLLPPPPPPLPRLPSELRPKLDPLPALSLLPPTRTLDRLELGLVGTFDPEPGRLGLSGGRGGVAVRPTPCVLALLPAVAEPAPVPAPIRSAGMCSLVKISGAGA